MGLGADTGAGDHPTRAEVMQLLTSPLEPGTGRRETTTTSCERCGAEEPKRMGAAGGDANPSMAGQGLAMNKRILILLFLSQAKASKVAWLDIASDCFC